MNNKDLFKKYQSIENSYRQRFINSFLLNENVKNHQLVLTEKIHGSNIGVYYFLNNKIELASRNYFLSESQNLYNVIEFFEISEVKEKFLKYIESIKKKYISNYFIIYFEYYGDRIQKIDYKNLRFKVNNYKRDFKIFDVRLINDNESKYLPFYELTNIIDKEDLVPIIDILSFDQALEFNVENCQSRLGGNFFEGVVIRGYKKDLFNKMGKRFILKKKTKAFIEKKKTKQKKIVNKDILLLQKEFLNYITENRLNNIFSKYGEITNPKEIGKYMKIFMEDAYNDFVKDFEDKTNDKINFKDKKTRKQIISMGNYKIVEMLKKYL